MESSKRLSQYLVTYTALGQVDFLARGACGIFAVHKPGVLEAKAVSVDVTSLSPPYPHATPLEQNRFRSKAQRSEGDCVSAIAGLIAKGSECLKYQHAESLQTHIPEVQLINHFNQVMNQYNGASKG